MSKTVLITGASSGIGKATALFFLEKGWNVVATARSPESIQDLKSSDRLTVLRLDVTDPVTIEEAVTKTIGRYVRIDVLVNNAGYGLLGPFEAATPEQIQRQFATNVFGIFEVTRSLLPHFRQQRAGIIINIASMGGRMAFPFASFYHATKWAIEGFSESLQYELEPFGIHVKVIEPGAISTGFASRLDIPPETGLPEYDNPMKVLLKRTHEAYSKNYTNPDVVAKVIYRAATDNSKRLRYAASAPILAIRKLLSDRLFFALIRQFMRS